MKCVFCKKDKAEFEEDVLRLRIGSYAETSPFGEEDGICKNCLRTLKKYLEEL